MRAPTVCDVVRRGCSFTAAITSILVIIFVHTVQAIDGNGYLA